MSAIDLKSIDWKGTGYLAGSALVIAGVIKRALAPLAIQQIKDAVAPMFDAQNVTLSEIRTSQKDMARELGELRERVARVEGQVERRHDERRHT